MGVIHAVDDSNKIFNVALCRKGLPSPDVLYSVLPDLWEYHGMRQTQVAIRWDRTGQICHANLEITISSQMLQMGLPKRKRKSLFVLNKLTSRCWDCYKLLIAAQRCNYRVNGDTFLARKRQNNCPVFFCWFIHCYIWNYASGTESYC